MKVADVVPTNEAFIDPRELINRANGLINQANNMSGGAGDQVQKIVDWVTAQVHQMKSEKTSEFQGHKFTAYLDKLEQLLG